MVWFMNATVAQCVPRAIVSTTHTGTASVAETVQRGAPWRPVQLVVGDDGGVRRILDGDVQDLARPFKVCIAVRSQGGLGGTDRDRQDVRPESSSGSAGSWSGWSRTELRFIDPSGCSRR
jgi:hypothetical protein